MAYKQTNKTIGQIGQELGVDYVLEGSARRDGGRVRVSAQLIRVSDQTRLAQYTFRCSLRVFGSGQTSARQGHARTRCASPARSSICSTR